MAWKFTTLTNLITILCRHNSHTKILLTYSTSTYWTSTSKTSNFVNCYCYFSKIVICKFWKCFECHVSNYINFYFSKCINFYFWNVVNFKFYEFHKIWGRRILTYKKSQRPTAVCLTKVCPKIFLSRQHLVRDNVNVIYL